MLSGTGERRLSRRGMWLSAVLAIVLLAGGAGWLLLRARHHRHIPPAEVRRQLPDNIEFRLNQVLLRGVTDGKVVWKVDAEHFDLTRDQRTFRITGLKEMALVKDGKQQLTVTAEGVEQNLATGDLSIFGHVTVTGKDLLMHTPSVTWSDRMQLLLISQRLAAQVGEITITSEKGARYQVTDSVLRCEGGITLGYEGNILRAGGVEANHRTQQYSLLGPVRAEFLVTDIQQWAEGRNLPSIPDVPEDIKRRYEEYCKRKGYRSRF